MEQDKRLQQLIEKGKKGPLNNKELMEMISLIGPDKALQAMKNNKE